MSNDRARILAAAQELHRRREIRKTLLSELHPAQRKVMEDPAQYLAVCASRRGGKTHLDATMITLALIDSERDVWTVFCGPTGVIAKELIWDQLLAMNERFQLGWKTQEHPTPYIVTPAGAKFRVIGLDDKAQTGKLRGKKYKLVIADEAKEYTQYLRELVDEIIGPAFMGVGGRMVVSGTPGRACTDKDYWYAINHGLRPGWSAHHWTLHSNPWIKNADEELAKVRQSKDWTVDNVIYLREYLGLWVSDQSERVYAYHEGRNAVKTLADVAYVAPDGTRHPYDRDTWIHTMAVDFGLKPDPCAWIILASHPRSRDVFVVYAEKGSNLLPDEAADRTEALYKQFRPLTLVGDGGGLGATYVEDFNRRRADRLKCWIKQANKKGKRDHQEIMSEEYRAGKIFVVLETAGEYAHEVTNLGWKTEERKEENPSQPNHCADAGLYGFMEHKAMYHQAEPAPPSAQEKEQAALRARQAAVRAKQTRGLLR